MNAEKTTELYQGPFDWAPIWLDDQGQESAVGVILGGFRIVDATGLELCRVPGEPGRELVINTLNAKYLDGGGQRLASGPCYCAVNENHPGVCQGADCYCHGEPGPRTDDDDEA